MPSSFPLPELERQREQLHTDLAGTGDFRPGSLNTVRHRCGKSGCACAEPDHPGHGDEYILSRKVAGKTVATHFRPGPALEKAQREVANYKRFRGLVQEIVEVNERICEARPVPALATDQAPAEAGGEKGGSSRSSKRSSRPR